MTNEPEASPSQMVAGLIAKRAEIANAIEGLQRQVKSAVSDLDRVEATLRIFKPDIDLSELVTRPVPPPYAAFKGEISRILLGALRATKSPLSTRHLAEVVMKERGMPLGDLKLHRTIQQRVGASLNNWKRVKKVLKSSPGVDGLLLWELDEDAFRAS